MKKLCFNPYLPFWETIPDGEPHVFGNRLYIYGSHDNLKGKTFCEEDYVCWSAPVDDLGDWRYEGVIYRKSQDPYNGAVYNKQLPRKEFPLGTKDQPHYLYAPDVSRGPDGRYYLYYSLDSSDVISVAVCDSPAGTYEFLDFVTREDGSIPEIGRWFDPAILCEESGNYLYYGFAPQVRFPGMEKMNLPGAMMVRLADDMHTIISEPVCVANGVDTASGTSYEDHPFFEAASIRQFGEWYYFVYSSLQGNELCYGISRTPEGPFTFKGVIVSNGDMGYLGNDLPVNYMGNNHGGLVKIKDIYYIFGHRHTHGTQYSRQGTAEEVEILSDGTIPQVEVTSCGLNGGPLPAKGRYFSCIACHLTGPDRSKVGNALMVAPGEKVLALPEDMPYITEESCPNGENGLKSYIYNLQQGAIVGFKYFAFDGTENHIAAELRGIGNVELRLDHPDGAIAANFDIKSTKEKWTKVEAVIESIKGNRSLYFYVKEGCVDFASFEIG